MEPLVESSHELRECPITKDKRGVKYFSLGNIPLVNSLEDNRKKALESSRYPLEVQYFVKSKLTTITHVVDPSLLFSHYSYKSGVSEPYKYHCAEFFEYINRIQPDAKSFLDIGGNDGTLLEVFRAKSKDFIKVTNIDPSSNLSDISRKKGIRTINGMFQEVYNTFLEDSQEKESFDVITSTNVFQHTEDIVEFVKGVKCLLSQEGVWYLEFPYWISSLKTYQFDQIYHEHIYYYTITSLNNLLYQNGLEIFDIQERDIHGGSLRVAIAHTTSSFNHLKTYDLISSRVKQESYYNLDYLIEWGDSICDHIAKCESTLKSLSTTNSIYGFGAAAKGCVYLNAMSLTYMYIPYVIDDTDLKQGKYIPGTGIEVVSRSILDSKQPDYILILAHNFKEFIKKSLRNSGFQGKFITLIPDIEISS